MKSTGIPRSVDHDQPGILGWVVPAHVLALVGNARTDWRTNPLTRMIWGIEPRNGRRKRQAVAALTAPLAFYLVFTAGALLGLIPVVDWGMRQSWRLSTVDLTSFLINSTYGTAALTILAVSIWRAGTLRHSLDLRRNWPDYHLTGLGRGQMVWAMSAPSAVGIALLTAVHVPVCMSVAAYSALVNSFLRDEVVICLGGMAAICVVFLTMTITEAALLSWPHTRVVKLLSLILAGPLLSPLFWLLILYVFDTWLGGEWEAFITIEVISWPFRLLLVHRVWRRAIARLEEELA